MSTTFFVATDRYRLAVATVPVRSLDGPPVAAVVPADLVDRIPVAEAVTITVDGWAIRVLAGGEVLDGELIPDAFPDYRRLLPPDDPTDDPTGGQAVPVGSALRAALAAAPVRTVAREQDGGECEVAVLTSGPDGIEVGSGDGGVGVDRDADRGQQRVEPVHAGVAAAGRAAPPVPTRWTTFRWER